jgi:hypothetical protein
LGKQLGQEGHPAVEAPLHLGKGEGRADLNPAVVER